MRLLDRHSYEDYMNDVATGAERPQPFGDWLTMDTAPKDGTRFLAWPDGGSEAVKCYWYTHPSVSGWKTDEIDCNEYEFTPTHWTPLPAAPSNS